MKDGRGESPPEGVEAAIGNTPLVRLRRLAPEGSADIYVKLEYLNPSGSTKDRAALAAVEDAEERGLLKPGGTIVESTSGNMGPALAMVGAARGYRVIIVMPSDVPEESRQRVLSYGAEVVQSPSIQGMPGATETLRRLIREYPDHFHVDQFTNPAGVRAHRDGTGREILQAMEDRPIDAFVAGVGTGATLMGVGEALKAGNPAVIVIAIEPARSPALLEGTFGPHRIPGIGANFVPPLINQGMLDEVLPVSDEEAYTTTGSLAIKEGFFAGPSSGANVSAALRVAARLGTGRAVVTVLPDGGERYLRSPL